MRRSDLDFRLTKHFKLGEFFVSSRYPHAFDEVTADPDGVLKLYWLCLFCLEPIREQYGRVVIHSGYRTPELNDWVKGSKTSQHLYYEAADIICPKKSMELVYDFVVEELEWKGEAFYYAKKGHLHVGMPNYSIVANHGIKEG